ncbi:HAD-IIA family hydrolase [Natronobacterium gregoryi]|nr:HAD-IIA family hydrolase [Natronobacterium gregoryi]AFZ74302.1 putative sugar phosphatase of HAD superfamily [Natronobacterium gregoryi SP2]PLK22219.1 HAD family hydrolase [Natronobacterium gregoryi SP2]SFI53302.1 Haloacid Dehalogenase Superfamily Class (subfamily) IIA [Natronobacterium gregoryi]
MTDYEGVILDVDGTIVRGSELIPGADDGLRTLQTVDCSKLLFSNNPTRGSVHYREKLEPHGFEVDPTSVLTSATVTAEYLSRTHSDESVYLVGGDRLASILTDAGLDLAAEPGDAEVVLGSFDDEFSYGTLWEALQALEGNVPFYGTDPDTTIPVGDGTIPGSGAILAAMEAVAGRDVDAILGKPSKIAADAAKKRLEAAPSDTLVVGDRLDTDVALGNRAGMTTAVVLTGVTDRSDLDDAAVEPDHVLESLGDLESIL